MKSKVQNCLFRLFTQILKKKTYLENQFKKYRNSTNILEKILWNIYNYKGLAFPCLEHGHGVILQLIQCFVLMRMQQYCTQMNANEEKINQFRKKTSKFCTTWCIYQLLYVQQYTLKYMKIENKYIFPVLTVLLSLLFVSYKFIIWFLFFQIHDLITFPKNYTAKDVCLQNKSRQKRILTIPTFQLYI